MTPVAVKDCANCGEELRVPYEDEEIPENCRHRIMREWAGDEPCALCKAAHTRAREKWLQTDPTCTGCKEREEREEEERRKRDEEDRWLARSGIPEQLCGLKWDALIRSGDRKVAIAAAAVWANADLHEARGIYLWGPEGTGKTRLAATAAWHRLHEKRSPLRWCSVAVLLAKLEASFSDRERQAALDVLTGDTPLVMDDIDKVNPSESKRAQLFAAIDRRVTAGVPLMVTGNLPPKDLESKLGGPIGSRLMGYALTRTYEMDGPDRRLTLDEQ